MLRPPSNPGGTNAQVGHPGGLGAWLGDRQRNQHGPKREKIGALQEKPMKGRPSKKKKTLAQRDNKGFPVLRKKPGGCGGQGEGRGATLDTTGSHVGGPGEKLPKVGTGGKQLARLRGNPYGVGLKLKKEL